MSTDDKYAMSKKEKTAFRAGKVIGAATLTDDMRALLTAVHAALDVPIASTAEDHRVRAELLDGRASDARIILDAVIRGDRIADCVGQLRDWITWRPVTYRVWVPAEQQDHAGADPDALVLDADPDQPVPHVPAARCPAAHRDDPTECDGQTVVTVLDRQNAGADGCEHHAARLLASLVGGRVYGLPDAPEGAALRVFKAADTTRPFAWLEHAPRTRPDQLSHHENREGTPVFEVEQSGADSDGWDPDDPYGDVDEYERGDR